MNKSTEVDLVVMGADMGLGKDLDKIAKSLGYYALCDHSIAHPSTIDCLVQNKGKFISSKMRNKFSLIF